MKTTTYTPEQIITIIEQTEKGEQRIAAICPGHGRAEYTFTAAVRRMVTCP